MTQSVAIGPEGTATVVLNGSGNGTAQVGPLSARETWQPEVASVQASSNNKEASCEISAGSNLATSRFVDQTLSGSTGDSTGNISGQVIRPGLYIFAAWTGGDPGATATLVISGTKMI